MNSSRLKQEFPIQDQGIYFNHATVSPWPLCAAQAVQRFAEENAQQGPLAYPQWIKRTDELREYLARLIAAPSVKDIALLKNTTEGVSTVAWGLDWKAGDNLVLPVGEFPSNHLPWLAQKDRGVEVRLVDLRAGPNAEDALLASMDEKTRLLAVSSVQWSDGFRLDLKILGEACKTRGILFFVDAIQHLGALRFDVESCHVDFLAADAHKWLLGPEGVAVFFSSEQARPQIRLRQQGWHMFDNPFQFSRDDWSPADSAARFEAGSPNTLGQVAMHASLELLIETGLEEVEQQILKNTAALIGGLQSIESVRLLTDARPSRRSGIVSFNSDEMPPNTLCEALVQRNIHCAVRGKGVRLSPHFYQGERETSQVLDAVRDVIETG